MTTSIIKLYIHILNIHNMYVCIYTIYVRYSPKESGKRRETKITRRNGRKDRRGSGRVRGPEQTDVWVYYRIFKCFHYYFVFLTHRLYRSRDSELILRHDLWFSDLSVPTVTLVWVGPSSNYPDDWGTGDRLPLLKLRRNYSESISWTSQSQETETHMPHACTRTAHTHTRLLFPQGSF